MGRQCAEPLSPLATKEDPAGSWGACDRVLSDASLHNGLGAGIVSPFIIKPWASGVVNAACRGSNEDRPALGDGPVLAMPAIGRRRMPGILSSLQSRFEGIEAGGNLDQRGRGPVFGGASRYTHTTSLSGRAP